MSIVVQELVVLVLVLVCVCGRGGVSIVVQELIVFVVVLVCVCVCVWEGVSIVVQVGLRERMQAGALLQCLQSPAVRLMKIERILSCS